MTRYIVDVETLDPAAALTTLRLKRKDLDTCKPGWGWSVRVNGVDTFCRRTVTGYSIKERRA